MILFFPNLVKTYDTTTQSNMYTYFLKYVFTIEYYPV